MRLTLVYTQLYLLKFRVHSFASILAFRESYSVLKFMVGGRTLKYFSVHVSSSLAAITISAYICGKSTSELTADSAAVFSSPTFTSTVSTAALTSPAFTTTAAVLFFIIFYSLD